MSDRNTAAGIVLDGMLSEANANTAHQTLVSVEAPNVHPVEVRAVIPRALQDMGIWGSLEEIVAHLKNVNHVPPYTSIEMEQRDNGDIGVRFAWWEITARVARNIEPPY